MHQLAIESKQSEIMNRLICTYRRMRKDKNRHGHKIRCMRSAYVYRSDNNGNMCMYTFVCFAGAAHFMRKRAGSPNAAMLDRSQWDLCQNIFQLDPKI